jgi:predicted metal-dependent hydrolase
MKEVLRDDVVGDVTICCTRRSRRISLSVKPSGEVRLSFPPYASRHRALEFLHSRRDWILAAKERFAQRQADGKSAADITPEQIEALRAAAKAILPSRVEELAAQHGLKYGRVSIRASRSKWGSCSATCNISLSLFLMILPEHLRDYVILHELAHTVHHNHSPRFHNLVNTLTNGREKALARELKEYSTR